MHGERGDRTTPKGRCANILPKNRKRLALTQQTDEPLVEKVFHLVKPPAVATNPWSPTQSCLLDDVVHLFILKSCFLDVISLSICVFHVHAAATGLLSDG